MKITTQFDYAVVDGAMGKMLRFFVLTEKNMITAALAFENFFSRVFFSLCALFSPHTAATTFPCSHLLVLYIYCVFLFFFILSTSSSSSSVSSNYVFVCWRKYWDRYKERERERKEERKEHTTMKSVWGKMYFKRCAFSEMKRCCQKIHGTEYISIGILVVFLLFFFSSFFFSFSFHSPIMIMPLLCWLTELKLMF